MDNEVIPYLRIKLGAYAPFSVEVLAPDRKEGLAGLSEK